VAQLQAELLDLLLAHVNIVRRCQVIVIAAAEETISIRHEFQNPFGLHEGIEGDLFALRTILPLWITLIALIVGPVLLIAALVALITLIPIATLFLSRITIAALILPLITSLCRTIL